MPTLTLAEIEELQDSEEQQTETPRLLRKEVVRERKRQIQKEYQRRKRLQYTY